jgi:flagellar motor switch protein FliM
VSNSVSPEEIDALLGSADAAPSGRVSVRDFKKPRRLSLAQQKAIRSALNKLLPTLEATVQSWLQSAYPLEISDIGETSAHGLFEALEDPIVVRTLEVGGAQGWVAWESPAAVAAATVAMSCELEEEAEPRSMTPLEAGLVGDLLLSLSESIAGCLGLDLSPGPLSQTVRSFLNELEVDESSDPQRLYLHLSLDGPGGPSTLRFYLPGILPEAPRSSTPPPALPRHLSPVPVEVCALLGTTEIQLDDLLKLEVGDVLPLSAGVGDPINISVEGRVAGKATWGNLHGQLAVRIEQLNTDR